MQLKLLMLTLIEQLKTFLQSSLDNILNGEMIKNKIKSHVHLGSHLQSDGGLSNHISGHHENACKRLNLPVLRICKHKIDKETVVKKYMAFIRHIGLR